MECLIRPEGGNDDRVMSLPNVPLVAEERWDGGPFLTYPLRRSHSDMYFGAGGTTEHPWEMRLGVHENENEDLQRFFQEWLFFGLIIEALDGNSETTSSSHLPQTQQSAEQQGPDRGDLPCEEYPTRRHKQTIISSVYREFIYQVDLDSYVTTRSFLAELHDSWAISVLSLHSSRNRLAVRCKRMRLCLRQAHYFYTHLPANFSPDIKFSIGAVAETIAHAMQPVCHWLKLDEICPNEWGGGYYGNPDAPTEVAKRMLNSGWCQSELVRTVNKFKFLHTLHYLSFVDKRKPARRLANCNKSRCSATDTNEVVGSKDHWKLGCSCPEIEIDHKAVMGILRSGNAVPLLVFKDVEQDQNAMEHESKTSSEEVQLEIEVISSTASTPYVAISHIWADGLGNDKANSLNACKLRELRRMVQALPLSATNTNSTIEEVVSTESKEQCPPIWLDTLCCPVSLDEKKLALTKMRQVYEDASSVLVLDVALQSYSTTSMDPLAILARIFTSRWLNRVWTLQEGALAKQLWFQFADKALSLVELKATMEAIWPNNLQQKIIFFDIRYEIDRIEQFFQTKGYDGTGPNLRTLDEALLHRGITDPSDEPLCIGTLMNLPPQPILAPAEGTVKTLNLNDDIGKDERHELRLHLRDVRMRVVWKLLAEKLKVLPAQIIFFEESRLSARGFRWAPQSLLAAQHVYLSPTLRKLRWDDQRPGILTNNGLKVSYPGYRLHLTQYNDGRPRHPWKGRKRPPEEHIVFRDASTGEWYSIATKQHAMQLRGDSTTTTKPSEFPLHDFIHQNSNQERTPAEVFLLMSEIDQGEIPHSEKNAAEGILTTGTVEVLSSRLKWPRFGTISSASVSALTSQIWQAGLLRSAQWLIGALAAPFRRTRTILARSQYHVIVGALPDAMSALYNTVEKLAVKLRAEESTSALIALYRLELDDEEHKVALKAVEQRMKDMMAEALAEDEELKTGIRRLWGDDVDEYLWVFIGDWFNHAFLGDRLEEDQVWIVD